MKPLEHSGLQCIYCDDLRDEKSGKTTILGWYSGEAIPLPPEEPLQLPTFCVVGLLALPPKENYATLQVFLTQNDEVMQTFSMPRQALNNMQDDSDESGLPRSRFGRHIRIGIKMNGLQIKQPCTLRMHVVVDDEEVFGNGLRFTRPSSETA